MPRLQQVGVGAMHREYLCGLICSYSLPSPAAISCCQKTGPRAMASVLVQLCSCYMVNLWHCSSDKTEAVVGRIQSSRRSWKRSLALGGSRRRQYGAGRGERLKSEFVPSERKNRNYPQRAVAVRSGQRSAALFASRAGHAVMGWICGLKN